MKYLLFCLAWFSVENALAVRKGSPSTRKEIVEIEEVRPDKSKNMGSGVVIDPHVIVTNGHVIPACDRKLIRVYVAEGKWIRPDAIDCRPTPSFVSLGIASSSMLAAVAFSQDVAFLVFKNPLPLPSIEPAWSNEDMTGEDVIVVGFGPLRKRLEGKTKLAQFQKSEFLRLALAEVGREEWSSTLGDGYVEIVADAGDGVMIENGDSGGAIIHSDSGKLIAINIFTATPKALRVDYGKDFGGAIHVNSPTFRERVRLAHGRFPWVFQTTDPVLKIGTPKALLEGRFLKVSESAVKNALNWYESDARRLRLLR